MEITLLIMEKSWKNHGIVFLNFCGNPAGMYLASTQTNKENYHNDVASESEIMPCNKIDKPLVGYRFTGNVMKSITTLSTLHYYNVFNARNQVSKYLSYDK